MTRTTENPQIDVRLSRRSLVVAAISVCLSLAGCSSATLDETADAETAASEAAVPGSVSLTVDFGSTETENLVFDDVEIEAGMAIEDLMKQLMTGEVAASQGQADGTQKPVKLRFESNGEGKFAFLNSIQGVANEGAGKRNWLYYVNEEKADRGFGVYEPADGDEIVWKFQNYETDEEVGAEE